MSLRNDLELAVIEAACNETEAEAMVGDVSLLSAQVRRRNAVKRLNEAQRLRWTFNGGSIFGRGLVIKIDLGESALSETEQFKFRFEACQTVIQLLNAADPPEAPRSIMELEGLGKDLPSSPVYIPGDPNALDTEDGREP